MRTVEINNLGKAWVVMARVKTKQEVNQRVKELQETGKAFSIRSQTYTRTLNSRATAVKYFN